MVGEHEEAWKVRVICEKASNAKPISKLRDAKTIIKRIAGHRLTPYANSQKALNG